jgi:hypothetical protein
MLYDTLIHTRNLIAMGMYTEIYVNVDLKKDTPDEIIEVLKVMCDMVDSDSKVLEPYPDRWGSMFYSGSCYTPDTHCRSLTYEGITQRWSLLGKGDIKNYGQEIQKFFEWIMPYVDGYPGEFIGYSRYEEDQKPTLVFLPDDEDT